MWKGGEASWGTSGSYNKGYALPYPPEVTGVDGEQGVNRNKQLFANGVFDGLQGLVVHPLFFVDSRQAEGIPQRRGFQLLAGKVSWLAEWAILWRPKNWSQNLAR